VLRFAVSAAPARFAVRVARAFTAVPGQQPIDGAVVVVADGQIEAVGRAADVALDELPVIDLGDATILPGLVDAHTHISLDVMAGNEALQAARPIEEQALRSVVHALQDLRAGTTTLRLMSEKDFVDVSVQRVLTEGHFPAPRLVSARRGIRSTNGHGNTAVVADGPDAVRRAARENLRAGAQLIKLFVTGGVATPGTDPIVSNFSRAEIAAAVEEAHRQGKPVAVHAYGGQGVDDCLEVGVDHIEHGIYMEERQYEAIARLDRWLVGTYTVFVEEPGPAANPTWPEEVRRKFLLARDACLPSIRLARRHGLKVALGTDAMRGRMADEAAVLVQGGYEPEDAIVAATRNGAIVAGVIDATGTLEPGKEADLLAVRGNPLADIRALKEVVQVWRAGVPVLENAG
jgi:imidazolonepropionase-like amidohydrolase